MKTKEEILEEHNNINGLKVKGNVVWKSSALSAMEEYANQFKPKNHEFTCKSVKDPNIKGYKLYTLDGDFLGELTSDGETK